MEEGKLGASKHLTCLKALENRQGHTAQHTTGH